MKVFVVGIGGGTASGKTTVANAFAAETGAALLQHDRYYRSFQDPSAANFDHPSSLETELLADHLGALREGASVDVPIYDFSRHARAAETHRVEARPVVVVEGILVLAEERLRRLFDLSVYVDCPDDLRLLRRMLRDMHERGRSVESVATQYLATVRPMHEQYVAPSAAHAGLRLDGTAPVAHLVGRVAAALPAWARGGLP